MLSERCLSAYPVLSWIKMPLEIGLGPGDFVLDGYRVPLTKKGAEPPQFSVHVYYGQTARCIKMPLGMEVGLGPGHIVLVGTQLHPQRKGGGAQPPIFGP